MLKKFLNYVILSMTFICCLTVSSCKDGGYGYDDPFISNIAGKWYINDESEYIEFYETDYIFEMNDWEVIGNFFINEDNPNEVLVVYDAPDGEQYYHTMTLHAYLGSNRSMWVDDAPMHFGERVLMYRPDSPGSTEK